MSTRKMRIVLIFHIVVAVHVTNSFDDVVTEFVGRDLLDIDLDEMAAMHDNSVEVKFGLPPKIFMRGKKQITTFLSC